MATIPISKMRPIEFLIHALLKYESLKEDRPPLDQHRVDIDGTSGPTITNLTQRCLLAYEGVKPKAFIRITETGVIAAVNAINYILNTGSYHFTRDYRSWKPDLSIPSDSSSETD